jgi:hypothetical protein
LEKYTDICEKIGKAQIPPQLTKIKKYDKIIIEKREKEI